MPDVSPLPLIVLLVLLLLAAIATLIILLRLYLRLRHGLKQSTVWEAENAQLREELHYLTELNKSMAELGCLRCFVADADNLDLIHQCGNATGRFSKIHSVEIFAAGMHEENRPHFLANCRKLLNGEISEFHEEYRYKIGNTYRRFQEIVRMLPTLSQQKNLLLLLDMDVSELEERTLHWGDAEQLLYAVFADAPGYVFLKKCDERFSYTRCNRTFSEIFGMTPQDVCGKTDDDLFDKNMALRIRASNLEALRSENSVNHKWYFPDVNGRQLALMCVQRVLHGKDGAAYILGMGLDISGVERVERSLKRRNQEFRMLLDALPCELLLLDRDLFILSGNHAMLTALNLTAEEVRHHRGTELDSGFGDLDPIQLSARTGEPHTATNERWQLTALPLTDDADQIIAYAIWRIPMERMMPPESATC